MKFLYGKKDDPLINLEKVFAIKKSKSTADEFSIIFIGNQQNESWNFCVELERDKFFDEVFDLIFNPKK